MVCCVVDCPNALDSLLGSRSASGRCFQFPKTNYKSSKLLELARKRRNAWIRALRIVSPKAEILYQQKVCFLHFIKGRPAKLSDINNPDWVPTQKLGVGVNRVCEIARVHKNHMHAEKSNSSRNIDDTLEISDSESFGEDGGNEYDEPNIEFVSVTTAPEVHSILDNATKTSTQSGVKTMIINPTATAFPSSGLAVDDMDDMITDNNDIFNPDTNQLGHGQERHFNPSKMSEEKLRIELKNKDEIIKMYEKKERETAVKHKTSISAYEVKVKEYDLEIKKLKVKLRIHDISFNGLKSDDDKVRNLTGLQSFALLSKLYDVVSENIVENPKTKIKAFDSFVITLMKLRLDLPISYLSYIFGVSPLTMSRMYREILSAMNEKIGPLVKWPDDETLLSSTPSSFKEIMGDKCIVLIHFLDILIKNLKPSRKGIQSMKHTIRYLIAFTPAGEIIYVSRGFGSSATNEGIIEESGFFDKISEQHIVLSVKEMFEESQKDNEQIQSIKHMAKNTEDNLLDILKDNFRILFNRQSVNSNGEVYSEFTVRCCCAIANLQMPESLEANPKETVAETVVVHTNQAAKKSPIVVHTNKVVKLSPIVVKSNESEDELL